MRGVKPVMKKMEPKEKNEVNAKFLQIEFIWPVKRMDVVTPLIETETRWLKSSLVGVVSFKSPEANVILSLVVQEHGLVWITTN